MEIGSTRGALTTDKQSVEESREATKHSLFVTARNSWQSANNSHAAGSMPEQHTLAEQLRATDSGMACSAKHTLARVGLKAHPCLPLTEDNQPWLARMLPMTVQ